MSVVFEKPKDLVEYLFRIVDNGGSSADRYTVAFCDGSYLGMSAAPTHPQGVSMWGEGIDPAVMQEWVENGEAVDLALGDLAPNLVQHILDRNNEGMADFLQMVEAKDPNAVAPTRDAAKVNEGTHDSFGKGIYWSQDGYRIRLDSDDPEEDRGPYGTARLAVLATVPDNYSFSGPEYHTTVDDLMRMEPSVKVKEAVEALEARRDAEWTAQRGM